MTTHRLDLASPGTARIKACSITYASLAAGTASITFDAATLNDTPVPWAYGDWVRLYAGASMVFMGHVTRAAPKVGDGGTEYAVELADAYDVLCATTYTRQDPPVPGNGPLAMGKLATSPHGTADLAQTLRETTAAAAAHMPASVELPAATAIGSIATNGSNTCAQLIEAASRWCPGLISWFDYSGTRPRLLFADADTLPVVPIPFALCQSVDVRPRHDLIPPVVALKAPDGTVFATIPEGADILTPGAFVYTMPAATKAAADAKDDVEDVLAEDPDASGSSSAASSSSGAGGSPEKPNIMEIVGLKLPEARPTGAETAWQADKRAFTFWQHHFPFLAQKDLKPHVKFSKFCRVEYDALPEEYRREDPVTGEETWELPKNYDVDAQQYELIRGNISELTPAVRWCYVTVEQLVCCTPDAPQKASVREFFPGDAWDDSAAGGSPARIITKRLYYRMIAISRSGCKYRVGGNYGEVGLSTPEDEAAHDTQATPEEEKEHGKHIFRYFAVRMPKGGECKIISTFFDSVRFVWWADGSKTYPKISRSSLPSQTIIHSYAPGNYLIKIIAREDDPIYVITPDGFAAETQEGDAAALLQNYWDRTRALQWDGSIALLHHASPWQLPGHRIRIPDAGYAPWETMRTAVQSVQIDMMTGRTSLTLGTREYTNFNEAANRATVADLRDASLVSETSCDPAAAAANSGSSGGGSGGGGGEGEGNPISPIFTAMDTGSTGGERRRPFSIYLEANSWYMEAGPLPVPGGGSVTIPRTLLPNYSEAYTYLHVLSRKPDGAWTWKLKKKKATT